MKKKIIIIAAAVIIVLFGAGLFIGNYFFEMALTREGNRDVVFDASHNQISEVMADALEGVELPEVSVEEWMQTVTKEQTFIASDDNLKLSAYIVKNEESEHRWAIVTHGYTSNADLMMESAKGFHELGFHVLMPDARSHGESEGNYIGMGWPDRLDLLKWIDSLIEQDPKAEIVLYGVSMGGATVMMTSGEDLPDNVKAIVEDCGYSSVKEEFTYQLKQIFGLPSFPFLNFASLVTKIRAGYSFGEADAIKQLKKATVPILFFHGDADTFVPSSMLDEVYEAAASEKEKILVEGAGHGLSSLVIGQEYWDHVERFLSKYMELDS